MPSLRNLSLFSLTGLSACVLTGDKLKEKLAENQVPTVSDVRIAFEGDAIRTNDVLTAVATIGDPDGDPVTTRYDWYVNSGLVQSGEQATLDGADASNGFIKNQTIQVTGTGDTGEWKKYKLRALAYAARKGWIKALTEDRMVPIDNWLETKEMDPDSRSQGGLGLSIQDL